MPHIHLRTSANLIENVDIVDVLETLVRTLSEFESIDSASVKAYHSLHTNWAMGEGARPGFAAVQVTLAEGRSPELLARISDALFDALREGFCASLEAHEVNITVEMRVFPRALYRKES